MAILDPAAQPNKRLHRHGCVDSVQPRVSRDRYTRRRMDMFKKQPSKVISKLVSVIPAVLVLSLLPSAVLAADVYASAAIDDQGQLRIRIKGGREILDRKSTRLNSSHIQKSRMPSSA